MGLELGLDPSRRAEAGYLRGLVTAATFSTMETQFKGENGQDLIRETLASVAADSTKTPAERRQWSPVYSYLNQFITSLASTRAMEAADSVSAAGVAGVVRATAPRTEAGPNIHVRDIVESDNGPRSAFEVTFPSAIMWALIGVCMSFAISIVDERIR